MFKERIRAHVSFLTYLVVQIPVNFETTLTLYQYPFFFFPLPPSTFDLLFPLLLFEMLLGVSMETERRLLSVEWPFPFSVKKR